MCAIPLVEEAVRDVSLSQQTYCEVLIAAVHWATEVGSPIDYCLLVVPEIAITGTNVTSQTLLVDLEGVDGSSAGQATVAVIATHGSFVAEKLLEGAPREAVVQFFSSDQPGAIPSMVPLVEQIVWPSEFIEGITGSLAYHQGVPTLHLSRRGYDEHYQSGGEWDVRLDPRQLVGLGM
eukprot:4189967-Amphidinium_carterae.1